MKNFGKLIVCAVISVAIFATGYRAGSSDLPGDFKIFYSLDAKQNDQKIIQTIDAAQSYVYFAIYTFTEKDIARALVRAKQRGVDVRGITDRDQAQISNEVAVLKMLARAGISVETQKHAKGIMHIKLLVTDSAYAVGSYNWTWSAANVNDEVLEISTNENLREQYLAIVKKVLATNR